MTPFSFGPRRSMAAMRAVQACTSAAAVVAATTGEEFAFQSIVVEQGFSAGSDYRLVGYRDGSAVSGATHDFTAGAFGSFPMEGTRA